jgi:hypothetical protein
VGAPDPIAEQATQEPYPLEALREMHELLDLVQHWRMKYERLKDEKDWRINRWRKARGK